MYRTSIHYALGEPVISLVFPGRSLLLHKTALRYLTRVTWLYTPHVPRSHIFLVQGSISTVLTET
jgi:hypothetical protein